VKSMKSRIGTALAALALTSLALTACGGGQAAGAAAVIGDDRVSTNQVSSAVSEINVGRGLAATTQDAALVQLTVQRLIRASLVDQAADRLDVTADQGSIDRQLLDLVRNAGSQEALDQLALDNDIPPSQLDEEIAVSILLSQIGQVLAPDATPEDQNALVLAYLTELSGELNITVSARFGTWEPTVLSVGPVPTDLATPAADPLQS